MRIPSVGWAFFGLAVVVLLGYVLDRGILVGTALLPQMTTVGDRVDYSYFKQCKYLHFGGVDDVDGFSDRQEAAEKEVCPMFHR
jgi:hypothetical protein